MDPPRRPVAPSLLGALAVTAFVAAACAYAWGFSVDDALITARVAHHLSIGAGYRFNPGGPVVDAVTPLGFAYILMPFAKQGPLAALDAARLLGAATWAASAGCLAFAVLRRRPRTVPMPLGFLALSAPLIAWAVAGMETAFVTVLATGAVVPGPVGALSAGLAAALRPELLPWALALSVGTSMAARDSRKRRALVGALAFCPALTAALIRLAVFDTPAPLAVFAKPSDTAHGIFYAAAALLWTGVPLGLVGGRSWARVPARERAMALAGGVHVVALVGAGGDWMPLARLFVPVLPSLVWVACVLDGVSPIWMRGVRLAVATVPVAVLWVSVLPEARRVLSDRRALIAELAPQVARTDVVVALDVGWVGASTSGTVVDLSGVTDPRMAVLPGGHTSKRLPDDFLGRYGVTVLVLRAAAPGVHEPWWRTPFATVVEHRVARMASDRSVGTVRRIAPPRAGAPHYVMIRLEEMPLNSGR